MRQIRHIVIHCSGTRSNATIEGMRAHWKSLGWQRVGYHRVIHADGTVTVLAADNEVTNGVAGHNSASIHLCYVGGIDGIDTRTNAQRATMARLVKEYQAKYPGAEVLGHRDFPGVRKACPSFDVRSWLRTI